MRTRLLSDWAARAFADLDPARILFEDDDLIAVDKPAGVACQAPDATRPDDLPLRIRRLLAARRGVSLDSVYLGTHQRLDADTSGVIVYTLRPEANAALAAQFRERAVEKHYLAAVSGKPPAPGSRLESHLARAGGRSKVAPQRAPNAKLAVSRVLALRSESGRHLLELAIDTGRTHQIRAQLAEHGCPLVGDALYGGTPAFRVYLHAARLCLRHPRDGRPLEWSAPPPIELEDFLRHGVRPAFRDPALLASALDHACQRRFALGRGLQRGETTVFRLLHEAADGVPGFGVDVYDDWLVVREVADVAPEDESALLSGLARLGVAGAYLKRHPKQANELSQGDDPRVAPSAPVFGREAPESLEVCEYGLPFEAHLHDGLRTGLFLDQRENRRRLGEIAHGKRVLNLFAYTGSFSVAALAAGATSVTTVDVSRVALAWAERNVARIDATERHRTLPRDAFEALEMFAVRGERFDLIVVDPPSYATTKRGRFRVTKDYVSLCRAAFGVLSEQGALLACLNARGVTQAGLRRFVHEAADAARLSLRALTDLPTQSDFPLVAGAEPPAKSVLAWIQGPELSSRARSIRRSDGGAARRLRRTSR
ncbi:MAG TPA: class I SAM-dependent methyltransferase [Polyangiales bacterium]|nr:class I SAM-dependent methyltransferase [Polyangiales bacterium]